MACSLARALLRHDPAGAERAAEALLLAAPGDPEALLILGVAQRLQGNLLESLALLKPLVRTNPDFAEAHAEWGLTQAAMGLVQPAIASLRRAVAIDPDYSLGWRHLADTLLAAGEPALADAAFLQQVRSALHDPYLKAAADAFDADDDARGEEMLRARLAEAPNDVAALRMLGDVRLNIEDNADAERLFERALKLAPSLTPARHHYATALLHQGLAEFARPHVDRLLAERPNDARYISMKASLLAMTGERAAAITLYRAVLKDFPEEARIWLRLGHALRTSGRQAEAIDAYRQAIVVSPDVGQAYWSLANLKAGVFSQADVAAMRAQLARSDIADDDRINLNYALGSALEWVGNYEESFAHFAAGAALMRRYLIYSAAQTTARMERSAALMSPDFVASRAGGGCADPAPIFVVGLPRSGSTLVEQILASHSQIEGTAELQDISDIAATLGWTANGQADPYPENLATLTPADRQALGDLYIQRTRAHRRRGKAFFVDKMPSNIHHLELIHLTLPNAKIIDIRRAPMAAGFAAFKQLFARGTPFSYDLRELGLYYRDYARLMDHYDAVLPGRVLRVEYERLVGDTAAEVRRLLGYCGLDFEPACLRFHETARDVLTASSEQVRRPIFREGLEQWRNYEPWLAELKEAVLF